MFFNLKLFFKFVSVISFCSGLFHKEDLQLNSLLKCLISEGVSSKNVHTRSSGEKYNELNYQWNSVNGYLMPLVYLVATRVSDIQKAVICSRLTGIRVVPRSGGHSFIKNSFGDSRTLIVDLASMNKVTVDPVEMTCEMDAGTMNGMSTFHLWKKGLYASQGICPMVGISGLSLGGGFGHFSRLFGTTADNVIEMEMVDAKGNLLVVNNSTNKDLFWALRGGGGGNFGIATKFKFKVYRAPESIVYGKYDFSFDDFIQFFTSWQALISSGLPNNVSCILDIGMNNIELQICAFNGPNPQNLTNISIVMMENFLTRFSFPLPTTTFSKYMTFTEFLLQEGQNYFDTPFTHPSQLLKLPKFNSKPVWYKFKSIFVKKILNNTEISKLYDLLKNYVKSSNCLIEACGGAINFMSSSSTAFIHRDNHYHITLGPPYYQDERMNSVSNTAMKRFYTDSRAIFNHSESYQNYLDEDLDDYLERYYGTNLKRLRDVKTTYDPENLFYHCKSIPVN